MPTPAGTAVLGGLLAVRSERLASAAWEVAGLAVRGLVDSGMHAYVHLAGRSTDPEAGLFARVAADGVRGLAVAAIVISLVAPLLRRRHFARYRRR